MDVTQTHFKQQLLSILKNIAKAKFVTFDFEMSGISIKPKYGTGDRYVGISGAPLVPGTVLKIRAMRQSMPWLVTSTRHLMTLIELVTLENQLYSSSTMR